jgi:hypothetical protein
MFESLSNPDLTALAREEEATSAFVRFSSPIFFQIEYNRATQPSATHVKAIAHRGDIRHEKQESSFEHHAGRGFGIRWIRPRPRSRR